MSYETNMVIVMLVGKRLAVIKKKKKEGGGWIQMCILGFLPTTDYESTPTQKPHMKEETAFGSAYGLLRFQFSYLRGVII